MNLPKLHSKIELKHILTVKTGLHIGSSKDAVEIGGIDLPVVRRKDNFQPYIPGSSLKGKLRSMLSFAEGELEPKGIRSDIRDLFGNTDEKNGNSSRLIVRDAYLEISSAKEWLESQFTDMPYTEVKFENSINKLRGAAENPRQIERVPAGAKFEVSFIINVMAHPNEPELEASKIKEKYIGTLKKAIKLLEHDYLGGHGSRGYGQVIFEEEKIDIIWPKNDE